MHNKKILIFISFLISFGFANVAQAGLIFKAPSSIGLISGLVGYWSFDGKDMAGNTAYDRSGQGNNGTLTNGPTRAIGKIGQGLSFAGTAYVNVGTNSLPADNVAKTISYWIKFSSAPTSAAIVFVMGNGDNGTYSGFHNLTGCSGVSMGTWKWGGPFLVCTAIPATNTWHHYVYTYDTSTHRLYLNGNLITTGGGATQSTTPNIAQINDDGEHFVGLIDDVRLYNRALSADEIKRLYRIGGTLKLGSSQAQNTGSLTKGLVGYWSFDESTHGTTSVADLSGNNNRGFMINGPQKAIGKIGQGLSFDGVDDTVVLGINAIGPDVHGAAAVTQCGRIYLDTAPSAGNHRNLLSIYGGATYGAFNLGINENLKVAASGRSQAADSFQSFVGTASVSTGVWTHICGILDYSNDLILTYINGALDSSGGVTFGASTYTHTTSTATSDSISFNNSGNLFDGLIDDVRMYNRALSADEIKRLYRIGGTLKLGSSQAQNTGSLTKGLVGYWSFDESTHGTTSVADLSGNNNRGFMINGPQKAIGKIGQGLSFDGSNDYVNAGRNPSLDMGANNFSVGGWIKTSGNPSAQAGNAGYGLLATKGSSGAGGKRYGLWAYRQTSGVAALNLDDDAAEAYFEGTTKIDDGNWHMVYGVRDGNTARIYVDGIQENTANITGLGSLNDINKDFMISVDSHAPTNYFVRGLIDDVRIYNRALSASEIQRLYNMGR